METVRRKGGAGQENTFWGRRDQVSLLSGSLHAIALLIATPSLVICSYVTLEHFDGSISQTIAAFCQYGYRTFLSRYFPSLTIETLVAYIGWISFQALLYSFLPGKLHTGQPTPGGNVLTYKINGFQSCIATVLLFAISGVLGLAKLSCIATSWAGILTAAFSYGMAISLISYFKARVSPSHILDTRFSGSYIHDFFSGCELNPRWGDNWDIKLFHLGHPGMMIAWLVIDISFASYQAQKHGYVTNSMIIVLILHGIYIIDFFWNEHWYLRTIDIHHDHFGFYLAWGSTVWLPVVYSLQAQFLAYQPVDLSLVGASTVLGIGILGYFIFRSANNQKLLIRLTDGNCKVWNGKPDLIRASYKTTDGTVHKAVILCSGWWGYARHANYVGDLMMAFAFCASCGTTHLLPWVYFLYLTPFLIHRCIRDESRCLAKYGEDWKLYCRKVPWRLVPGIF